MRTAGMVKVENREDSGFCFQPGRREKPKTKEEEKMRDYPRAWRAIWALLSSACIGF